MGVKKLNLLNLDDELSKKEEYGALLVQKTLRSGQTITHEGSVVIVGDVNPGAEVIAGGNVIIMGVARGVVHAGAFGNSDAVVIAFRLQPTQLRIANHITRAPDDDGTDTEHPEIAKVKDAQVVIDKFKLT